MIPLFKVAMSEKVKEPLLKTLYSGYVGQGEKVKEFEKALIPWVGNKYVLTTAAGTHAIHLALVLSGVSCGDRVITTPLTCAASNWPIMMCGAEPVWCDVDSDTLNIDPICINDILREDDKRIKAILVVHWGGYPCDLSRINSIADYYEIPVIEDAAHAFGSLYHWMKIGSVSAFTCFSFQAIKTLTTVDGGVLTVRKEEDYERAKLLRWYGIDRETHRKDLRCEDDIFEWGYKYHMNDVNATIGLENLECIEADLVINRKNALYYDDNLFGVPGVILLKREVDVVSSYWLYTIRVEERKDFAKMMTEKGIMVSPVHVRNDKHTCVGAFKRHLPVMDKIEKQYICIPVGWWVTKEQREYIVDCIRQGW